MANTADPSQLPEDSKISRGTLLKRGAAAAAAVVGSGALASALDGGPAEAATAREARFNIIGRAQPITLQVWHTYNAAETTQFVKEVNGFEQANPGIKLNLYSIPFEQRATKVPTAVQTNSLPDILRADYPYQFYLAALGKALPLDEYMSGWDGFKDMPSWLIDAAKYNGHIVTIPMQPWPWGLFYNKTLFKKAGIAAPPKTWDEFIKDAKLLTGNGVAGFDLMGDTANGNQTFFIMNSMMGGSVFKDPNNPTPQGVNLLSPQTKATLDLYDEMFTNHVLESGVVANNFNDMIQVFQSGKAAMAIDGSWEIGTYDLVKGLDYGVAPLWTLPGAPYRVFSAYSLYVVPSTTKYPKQAAAALEWLLSKANVLDWSTSLGEIPALRQSVESSPQMKAYLATHPKAKAFDYPPSSYAPFYTYNPPVPYWNAMSDASVKVLEEYYLGRITKAEVLPQMQAAVQAAVKANM